MQRELITYTVGRQLLIKGTHLAQRTDEFHPTNCQNTVPLWQKVSWGIRRYERLSTLANCPRRVSTTTELLLFSFASNCLKGNNGRGHMLRIPWEPKLAKVVAFDISSYGSFETLEPGEEDDGSRQRLP